ncbi:MAG: site-specific DNA-methyltransferase [Phocaeicola sp.]
MKLEHLKLTSESGAKINLEALYQICPACFTETKDEKTGELRRTVNFTTLRQLLGDDAVEDIPEAYEFNWVGKQEARREVARPITKTLRPVKEDSVDWDTTQNIYIEGDNLEALKLLQKSYLGKVKMIYIDPPYNTGNDFVYDDDFAISKQEDDLAAGNVDEQGNRFRKNTDTNSRFHSDWCSMIYSRLMLAKTLLREDGVIFISIDDNEVRNLRNICDEVFGEANFEGHIHWRRRHNQPNDKTKMIGIVAEHILAYSKDKIRLKEYGVGKLDLTASFTNPDNDPKGPWASKPWKVGSDQSGSKYQITTPTGKVLDGEWMGEKTTYDRFIEEGRMYFPKGGDGMPRKKYYQTERQEEGQCATNWWPHEIFGNNQGANDYATSLFQIKNIFSNPKPIELIRGLLKIGNVKEQDVILDFFSGSSTSADAVMQLNAEDQGNRKYIMVQLSEETTEDSEAHKAGYATICEIGKERIRRAGKKIKEESPLTTQDLDTGFRVFRIDESNMKDVYFSPKAFKQDELNLLLDNVKEDRTDLDLLFGCMLDWGVQLSMPMTQKTIDSCTIYTINEGDLVACFNENITDNVVKAIAAKAPLRIIFRDTCFAQDDAKINIYESFKQLMDWSDDEVYKNIKVI